MLQNLLTELKSEELSIGDDNISASTENMRSFYIDSDTYKNIGVNDIANFLSEVMAQLRQLWNREFTFYCWFDEMAGQIRFSSLKGVVSSLPFRSSIEETNDKLEFSQHIFKSLENMHSNSDGSYYRDPLFVYKVTCSAP